MSDVLASLIVKIGADIKDYSDGMKQSVSILGDVSRKFESLGANLTAALTVPIVGLGAAAIETAGKFEQTQIAFTHFLGSVQAARGFLDDLYNFAATTPFQIGDVTKGAQALMAMGFAAKDIVPDLRILGDQLSAVGRTENMQQIILAFGEMKAKGVASMKEIRQMVTDGVIPAVKYLAEGLGITETEVFEKLKNKAIDSGTAIKLIMAGMAKDSGGMMSEQMESFNGQMSNLKDKITLALKDIGDSLLPLAKSFVSFASRGIAAVKDLTHAFASLPVAVQEGIIALAGVAAAIGPALLAAGILSSSLRSVLSVIPILGALGNAITGAGAGFVAFAAQSVMAAVSAIGDFSVAVMAGASPSLVDLALSAIPKAIAALGELAVAIYSRVLVAFVVLQTGGVAALGRSLYAMISASTAATAALASLGLAVSVASAAFIGWQVGKWVYENGTAFHALGDAIGDFIFKAATWVGWIPKGATATGELQAQVNKAALALKEHNIVIKQGSLSLEEYAAKLRSAMAGVSGNTSAMDRAIAAARDLKLINQQNTEALDGAEKALAKVRAAYKLHAASAEDVAAAEEVVRRAMAAVNPEYHATADGVTNPEISQRLGRRPSDLA